MARPGANLVEGVEFSGPGQAKESVPCVGPKPHDAGKAGFNVAKFHRAQQGGQVSAERPNGRAIVQAGIYCCNQEDRGSGERCSYKLCDPTRSTCRLERADRIGLHTILILDRDGGFRTPKYRASKYHAHLHEANGSQSLPSRAAECPCCLRACRAWEG